jgi:poly(3-hydroxyalkanoate) synthetase
MPNLALLWPAFAAASASEIAAAMARQFTNLAVGPEEPPVPEPRWATPNRVVVELESVRLRDFSRDVLGVPTLLCAPLALHGAMIADLAPEYSLVGALRAAGLHRILVTDWRSARPEMRFRTIDDYLSDLNVLIDEIGPPVDLIGLCQGGWLSLIYAASFPRKVRKLVLAAAPVDIAAAPSALTMAVAASPALVFHELVRLGDGLVSGTRVLKFWTPESVATEEIHTLLEAADAMDSEAFRSLEATFRAWYGWTLDLPGRYFLEAVDRLYKRNEIATGHFVALGRRVDLTALPTPLYLLAARDDELVAPAQLFAAERMVATPAADIRKATAPCRHLGLFMGRRVLGEFWPDVAAWLLSERSADQDYC